MSEEEVHIKLYSLWENGEVPNNFPEDHSENKRAIDQIIRNRRIEYFDFF